MWGHAATDGREVGRVGACKFAGGVTLINANFMKVDFTCTVLYRDIYSRLILVSMGGRGTRKRTVSLGRNLSFTGAGVGVCTNSCASYESTSVMIVYTNMNRGPKRSELSLLRQGARIFGAVVSPVVCSNFGKVFLITAGPISVVAGVA